jgi:hypothetical protein
LPSNNLITNKLIMFLPCNIAATIYTINNAAAAERH